MKAFLRLVLRLLFRIGLVNQELLHFTGPALVVPNHLSLLDPILLFFFLPKDVVFVVNTQIARRYALVMRFCRHITIDPLNPYSLKRIVGLVKKGETVVIFPEGRITTTGGLMKVYDGVGFIALKTGAPIYPVIFTGLEYSKFSYIQDKVRARWFPRVQLYVEQPLRLQGDNTKSIRLQKREISNQLLEMLQQALFKAKRAAQARSETQTKQESQGNLFNRLLAAAHCHGRGKKVAEDITGDITYRKLLIAVYLMAAKFSRILRPGERVGVLLPNSIAHVVTLFALFFKGDTPAILNFSAGIQNNLDCAETAGVRVILTSRSFIARGGLSGLADQLAARFLLIYLEDIKDSVTPGEKLQALLKYLAGRRSCPADPSQLILFTSGSESKPKGVVLTQDNILANIDQVSAIIDFTPRDKILNVLPMFHSFGLTAGTILPLLCGLEVFLYPSPLHYKVIPELTYDRNASIIFGTSTFLAAYGRFAHPYDFHSLRYVFAGAEKLKEETRNLWQQKFGIRILEGYGTTETAPILSLNTPLFNKQGTVGKFVPGIKWRLEQVEGISEGGNLLVKGPNVMAGYLLSGQGFVPASEWYNCGDVVEVDSEGYITIQSRLKRFAKVTGEMISLNLIEELAGQCFGTEANAVVNIPDQRKGEIIVLFTTAKNASRQALRDHLALHRHSMLLMPSHIEVVDAIPLLGSGKPDYVTLKEQALGRFQ
ncbi:MAG TPA: AMP-binding protein [Bacillota bacterium]|nr:AMP-binding protein [Bacillota bacterium]